MGRIVDLAGQRFGRLVAVGNLGANPETASRIHRWICNCDCGNVCTVLGTHLRRGATRSCGCVHREWCQNRSLGRTRLHVSNRLKEMQFTQQAGLCGVCGKPLDLDFHKAHWDHNHDTRMFRELVHSKCNTLLGFLEGEPDLVFAGFQYLEKHLEKHPFDDATGKY